MNKELLKKHIQKYYQKYKENPKKYKEELLERKERIKYYQSWTKEKILKMDEDDLFEYISKLWSMLIWGNKRYVADKIIQDNGLDKFKKELNALLLSTENLEKRWDKFRKEIKGFGYATMSELLSHVHPDDCMVWNRRALVAFKYLGIEDLPFYDYQCTGKKYKELCEIAKEIAKELSKATFDDVNLLTVDYFIWDELQVEDNLSKIKLEKEVKKVTEKEIKEDKQHFIHNEIRDKISDIGGWLGFDTKIETKVADGSVVDVIWEATIGNMGRVIYVFEVQTKGSIDSLIVNLLKSLNNPAVQGVVAVSDEKQLEKIERHAKQVKGLKDKLKYWDYKEVLENHESYLKNCV
jgi:hypothetical protein